MTGTKVMYSTAAEDTLPRALDKALESIVKTTRKLGMEVITMHHTVNIVSDAIQLQEGRPDGLFGPTDEEQAADLLFVVAITAVVG